MSTKPYFLLAIIVLTALGFLSIGALVHLCFYTTPEAPESLTLRFEILKVLLVSVVIGILGMLVPNWFEDKRNQSKLDLAKQEFERETERQQFETKKEGRRLYSQVKTGLVYLAQRLAVMEYAEAMKHLETLHQSYHLVVLYPDSELKHIGNYATYFESYHIHKLRKAMSTLMCEEAYLQSRTLDRIEMIEKRWDQLSASSEGPMPL